MLSSLLASSLLFALALGTPVRRTMQVHESRAAPPAGYTLTGPVAPYSTLTLRLALVSNDSAGLVDALYDVSTPGGSGYGQHLSKEEVEACLAPTAESASAVSAWLSENGLSATAISAAGDWLAVELTAGAANDLLATDFSVFTHAATGKQTVRTLAYSIPTDLAGHLDFVHPTISFPSPYGYAPMTDAPQVQAAAAAAAATGPCNISLVTPACLEWLYGIPTTPAVSDGNAIAVTGYVEQWPQEADLKMFLTEHRPDMNPDTTWTLVELDGGADPQSPADAGIEANLDIQYTIGLATDVPVTFISVGGAGNASDDYFAEALDTVLYMLNLTSPPQVMTTSYGVNEEDVLEKLAYALCNSYAALGARGVSVLFASGDGGVAGSSYFSEETCTTFIPTFPPGCPYVTSVGGTWLVPETAVNFSSGGFSTYFARPAYQDGAVAPYLAYLGAANAGLYNSTGRGFPDVAAYAVAFDVVWGGVEGTVTGTSCATPTFASVVSLLNDRLIAASRPALGWLNPWLYAEGYAALTDITTGSNYACSNYTTGFNATVGWDPVTGLGTPDFSKLTAILGL